MIEATVFDYGVGNLHGLSKALERSGARVRVATDAAGIAGAACLVLPGVGAAGRVREPLSPAAAALRRKLESGVPALGVCVGMQVVYEESEEGATRCLGYFGGGVRRLRAPILPHIGWSPVAHAGDPLFAGIPPGESFYFVHSFAAAADGAIATAEYGERFAAASRRGNVWGVQFHPEKSSRAGLAVLANFVRLAEPLA